MTTIQEIQKIEEKNKVLKSTSELFYARENIVDYFKEGIFLYKGNVFKSKEKNQQKNQKKKVKIFFKYIEKESKDINYDLFKTYFNFVVPSSLAKKLYETKGKKKNDKLVKEIKNKWSNLKDEIEKMSEDEKKIEQPDIILKIVKEILDFNKQSQIGKGLKILTPDQMLSRLPITLAQLNAGNNSEKLKNEIRQSFYSLYRSKKLTKQIYKNLIDSI